MAINLPGAGAAIARAAGLIDPVWYRFLSDQLRTLGTKQDQDALLDAIAALSMVADRYIYGTGTDTVALGTITAFARTLLDDADAATARATLGAQPLDSDLTAIAALTTTAYGRAFLELANQAATMALLSAASASAQGIVELATSAETITGTDTARAVTPAGGAAAYQPLDADLTAIAALTTTAFGRGLLALADAAALRTSAEIEFGTFTPTMAFSTPGTSSFAYSTQNGNYVKVGTFYGFYAQVVVTPTIGTGSGDVRLGGLPATIGSRSGTGWITGIGSAFTWPASRTMMTYLPDTGVNYGRMIGIGTALGNSPQQVSGLTGGASHDVRYGGVFST